MRNAPRLTIAVSLTAALILGGIGIAGLAAASDEAPLTTLSLPGPRVGDEARYEYIQTEGGLESPTIVDGPLDGFTIAFREPRVSVDTYGVAHMANSFYEKGHGYYQLNGDDEVRWNQYADWTRDIDVETGEVIAYWMEHEQRMEEREDGKVVIYSQGEIQLNEYFGGQLSVPYNHPCFTFNAFQEQALEVVGSMELHGDCSWLRKEGTFGDGHTTYIPVGIERFDDMETIHFVQDSPVVTPRSPPWESRDHMRTGGTHVWLSADYPYPVKIAHPMDDEGDRYDVYVMREFFRGDEPLATIEDDVDGDGAIFVENGPRTKLGPTVGDLAVAFTPQEAYDAALADQDVGLQAFLDAHPDAYTGRVYHSQREHFDSGGEDIESTFYRFHVTAGGTTIKVVEVRHEVRTPHDSMGQDQEPTVQTTVNEGNPDTKVFPDPSIVPEKVPTVASVADVWRTIGSHERQANTYSFSIWCGDEACERPVVAVSTGHQTDWAREAFQPGAVETVLGAEPEAADSLQEEDTVDVRIFDDRQSISTSSYRVFVRDQASDEPLDSGSEAVLTKSALTADSVWEFPSAAAVAGIGAGGLLFGSAVAGWPALKGGLLAPLFSRVHRQEALDHPLRRRLQDVINQNAGIHLQGLVDALGEPRSTVLHHLRTLERTGLVQAEHSAHYTCYFSKDRAARLSVRAAPVVKAEGARSLLDAIAASPGVSVKDAAARAGLSLSTAYYHARRLRDAGLVDTEGGLAITATGRATLGEILH